MKLLIFILFLFQAAIASAEPVQYKVARNAINCFVGHMAAGSYMPKVANRYLAASFILVGQAETDSLKKDAESKLAQATKMLNTSEKEEGIHLVYEFCPQTHELTAPNTRLGNKIDEFARKYDSLTK